METISINLYSIEELKESAQEKAWLDNIEYANYAFFDEDMNSVDAFLSLFNARVIDYSIGTTSPSYIKTNVCQEKIRGVKLKDIEAFQCGNGGNLTGTYLDDVMVDAFVKNMKINFGNALLAIDCAITSACNAIVAEMEYAQSKEAFIELASINEYKFLENGKLWRC